MNAPTLTAQSAQDELAALSDASTALGLQTFFKTGEGQYGAGDVFRGIRVPTLRKLSLRYQALPLPEVELLLTATQHEDRLLALLIMVRQFGAGDALTRSKLYNFYLAHTRCINNWDLVDSSADPILGGFLQDKAREPLYDLARSTNLWERRMAIIATFYFIKRGECADTLSIADILIPDSHDLIHKAAGWMLREVGKRDKAQLTTFLETRYQKLPRTMLRYAIEKFSAEERGRYLRGEI